MVDCALDNKSKTNSNHVGSYSHKYTFVADIIVLGVRLLCFLVTGSVSSEIRWRQTVNV